VTCEELQAALQTGDPGSLAAARVHAADCPGCRAELEIWDDISAAARSLHREWDSPGLWPRIAAAIRAEEAATPRRGAAFWRWPIQWQAIAAAILVLAMIAPLAWYGWHGRTPAPLPADRATSNARLLNEQALSEIERAEAEYVRAVDALSRAATARIEEQPTPLLLTLRERLIVIDAAIAECRAAIERNRFNAHLRRELLSIYQEKQRTLQQILEQEKNVS
jgi:hypothetical protein